jgi:hypothetical protein
MTTIEDIERSEFKAVDALSRLSQHHSGRPRIEAALAKLRVAKSALLAANGAILRKGSVGGVGLQSPRWVGLPIDQQAAAEMAKAARDRVAENRRIGAHQEAERRRLGLHGGRRRYAAPNELKSKRIALPGRMVDVPSSGIVEIEEGAHPAARGNSESPDHQTLAALGFRRLPDNPDEVDDAAMKAITAVHRQGAIRGDAAVMRFLSGSPRAR